MVAKAWRGGFALGIALAMIGASGQAPTLAEPPGVEEFLVIPLRMHVLTSATLQGVDCRLTDEDLRRIVAQVNRVWHAAGIHWGLESIVREPAANQEAFRLASDLDERGNLGLYRLLIPDAALDFQGLHVYYLHDLPVNGVWLGGDYALVKETARLRAVKGGIDEPLPRVTAHELGHVLGLAHRQDETNLLASGTTGTALNAAEIATARINARQAPGARTRSELKKAAETAGRSLDRRWLDELPAEVAKGPE